MFVPMSIKCLKNYSKEQFMRDVISGIIVAIIALPLSIALAIASGVSPEKGLYTAIIGGFFVSILGGSRVQIGGPTGAFVVIVYGIIQKFGIDGLIVATIMAGFFLVIMGFCKLGNLIKYIPSPITTGFTSGIAIVILSSQIKDFLGLKMKVVPSDFLGKCIEYVKHIDTINYQSLFISLLTLAIIVLWPKINKKIPGTFIAIILVTIVNLALKLNITTIGSQYSNLSSALPSFEMPNVTLEMIKTLILPAFTIAILGAVESLLSAVVSDGMIGGKHNSNMELIGQGVGNIFSGAFGGIPVTGAIARTAANVKNGGRTPMAGIVHSITLLVIMLIFMPYVKLIPMAALASVLVVVAYNMGDWEVFEKLKLAPKSDALVFIVTFLLTIFLDLVVAIGVGIVLASLLFIKRMAEITNVRIIFDEETDETTTDIIENIKAPEFVTIYEIKGPFFFGAANKFVSLIRDMGKPTKILIIKMKHVPVMDSTAFHSLEMLYDICRKHHTRLILLQLQEQPMSVLKKYGFDSILGEKNFCNTIDEAVKRANSIIDNHTSKNKNNNM